MKKQTNLGIVQYVGVSTVAILVTFFIAILFAGCVAETTKTDEYGAAIERTRQSDPINSPTPEHEVDFDLEVEEVTKITVVESPAAAEPIVTSPTTIPTGTPEPTPTMRMSPTISNSSFEEAAVLMYFARTDGQLVSFDYADWRASVESVPEGFLKNEFADRPVLDNHVAIKTLEISIRGDQMAILLDSGQLVISTLDFSKQTLAAQNLNDLYGSDISDDGIAVNLQWLPNDNQVIVVIEKDTSETFIYDSLTDTFEPWPYNCNTLAIAPDGGEPVVWCAHEEQPNRYAIIYSDTVQEYDGNPGEILTKSTDSILSYISWSQSGKYVAYFRAEDPSGSLAIYDVQSGIETIFENRAAWWTSFEKSAIFVPDRQIVWSEGEEYLLYFGIEEGSQCPQYYNEISEKYWDVACWRLIDLATGNTVWQWGEIAGLLGDDVPRSWTPFSATLSPNGGVLVFSIFSFTNDSFILVVDNSLNDLFLLNTSAKTTVIVNK